MDVRPGALQPWMPGQVQYTHADARCGAGSGIFTPHVTAMLLLFFLVTLLNVTITGGWWLIQKQMPAAFLQTTAVRSFGALVAG